MSIEFDETIRAIYYLSGNESDWLAAIHETAEGGVNVTYRFRYYDPADPDNDSWSGKDKKNWYEAKGKPGEPTLAAALHLLQTMMDKLQAAGFVPRGGLACKLLRGGSMTLDQFIREFEQLPFVHRREEDAP